MPENFGQVKTAQLHHFGDASEQGYGTANYRRFTGEIKVDSTQADDNPQTGTCCSNIGSASGQDVKVGAPD